MLRELLLAHSRVLFIAVCVLGWASSHAQSSQLNATCSSVPMQATLLSEVHTIADPSQAVPVECSFDVSIAGTYQVTLSDLGVVPGTSPSVPAPLAAVKLGITSGSTVVGTPLTAAGTMQFDANPGTYVIHVVGLPGSQPGSGPIGINVTNTSAGTLLASFSSILAAPPSPLLSNEKTIDDSFSVTADGSYVVTLSDLQLPQALTALQLLITTNDGTAITTPPLGAPGTTTVALQHGVTYRIFAVGQSDAGVNAGLFSAVVAPAGGGAPVYNKVVAIGAVTSLDTVALSAGVNYALSLADLSYPAALVSLKGIVVSNGQAVAQVNSAGSSPTFSAVAGNYQVFALATAATAGSYAASLAPQGGTPALSLARAVSATGATAQSVYYYDTTAATAGTYSFDLTDFSFPATFASLSGVLVQNGAVIGQPLSLSGTQTVTVAAGPVSVLVFSQPAAAGSLFGVDLTPAGGGTPIFAATRGVGQLFSARQVSITSAGNYAVNVTDVKFPSALATFAVVVTRGSTQYGSIFGGGAFSFAATPGNYFINFIAKPSDTDKAGTYSLKVAPAPAVTLQSDVTTVASGGVVHLTWSSQNSDGCTASGGWSGSQSVSGTATSSALTQNTTFTLTCSGGGTTAAASATVNVSAPPASGKGGGGALGSELVIFLLGLVLYQARHGVSGCARRLRHAFVMHSA